MYKHLYDCFNHWYHGGQILFYSDTHFDDKRVEAIRRVNAEQQIRKINKYVGKNDTLIILGDIGTPDYLNYIKGHKIIVLGNHDHGASIYKPFVDEVYEGILTISDKIVLSHEPVEIPFMLNIHGHIHHGNEFQDNLHINCCAEIAGYVPFSLKKIIESGILKDIPNIHRQIIDNAVERKLRKEAEYAV